MLEREVMVPDDIGGSAGLGSTGAGAGVGWAGAGAG